MEIEKQLAFDLIQKFRATIAHKCLVCGSQQSAIPTECTDAIEKMFRKNRKTAFDDLINQIPVITVHCCQCGHVDQYAYFWAQTAKRLEEQG